MVLATPIEGPAPTPPAVSLVRQAQTVDGDGRWMGGFSFRPRGCTDGMQGFSLCDPAVITPTERTIATGVPFTLTNAEICQTFGFEAIDYERYVREAYEAFEPGAIESEFWTGTLESAGLHLAAGGSVTNLSGSSSASLAGGLGALEAYLGTCGPGGRGMIHMSRRVMTAMAAQHLLWKDGSGVYTFAGTIVVPGVGYPGSGPAGEAAGATEWIYGTGRVMLLRSKMRSVPDPANPNAFSEALRRDTNEVAWQTQRTVGAVFDPCCLGTIALNMADLPDSGNDFSAGGTLTNRSGTITAGGTAQQVMAANSSRKYLLFQNVSDTAMWIDFGATAVADSPSVLVPASGGAVVQEGTFVSTQSVSVFCATTGKKFTAKEG